MARAERPKAVRLHTMARRRMERRWDRRATIGRSGAVLRAMGYTKQADWMDRLSKRMDRLVWQAEEWERNLWFAIPPCDECNGRKTVLYKGRTVTCPVCEGSGAVGVAQWP